MEQAPEVAEVDEAGAEATLLTLGSSLKWRRQEEGKEGGEAWAYVGVGWFKICPAPALGDAVFVSLFSPGFQQKGSTDFCPYLHHSLVYAKAACECHYATGK